MQQSRIYIFMILQESRFCALKCSFIIVKELMATQENNYFFLPNKYFRYGQNKLINEKSINLQS